MENLMSDLLATARGEPPKQPSYHFNTYHHAHQFINDEVRLGHASFPDEPINASFHMDFSTEVGSSSENETSSSPSYVPLYSPSGYSSSPTYVRGDFYNISPSATPSIVRPPFYTHATSTSPGLPLQTLTRLSFSIESILGSTAHVKEFIESSTDSPAIVTSSLPPSPALCNWSSFQRKRCTTTSLPVVYWCHVCRAYCSSPTDASDHQIRHSEKQEPNTLRRCFSGKHGYVTSHVQTDFLNRVKCGLCDRIVTKCFFNKHMRCHESWSCHMCGVECATQSRLEDHMNMHTGNQPHTCTTCGAQFGDRQKLTNHSRQHRTSSVACRFCEKTFRTKYTCTVHERIHTGYKPFACHVTGCKKAFPQKIQLHLHMRLHEEKRI